MSLKLIKNATVTSILLCTTASVVATPIKSSPANETQVVQNQSKPFSKHLEKFEEYLGGWTAEFSAQAGQPSVTDVTLFEKVLNGNGLKTTHSINEGVYGGESIIFWNNKTNRLEFYYFTTANFFTSGWMEFINENTFVAYENVTGESTTSQGISQVKSTSTLNGDSMTVSTSYFKNGEWTDDAKRIYTRTNKNVVFK
ncbi:hypothetical protein N9L48_05270 [Psychrosphaera sp.]|nr:hypothetical protein [Psychrosphaera sp.]